MKAQTRKLIEVRNGVLIVLVIAAIMLFLTLRGLLHPWETALLDPFLRARQSARINDFLLVSISDEDYRDLSLFRGQSPLRRSCVDMLIRRLAAAHPRLLVVDLDLSDAIRYNQDAPLLSSEKTQDACGSLIETSPPPSFPARVAEEIQSDIRTQNQSNSVQAAAPPIIWTQTYLEGTDVGQPISILPLVIPHGLAALPVFLPDRDGQIRTYLNSTLPVKVIQETSQGPVTLSCEERYTFAGAALALSEDKLQQPKSITCSDEKPDLEKQQAYLRFSSDRNLFTRMDVQNFLAMATPSRPSNAFADKAVKGKIVILGGAYSAARDSYATPIGRMDGMELVALAISAELNERGSRQANEFLAFAYDLAVGIPLVLAGVYLPRRLGWRRWVIVIAIALILPAALCIWFYKISNFFLNVLPVILGADLHLAYDWGMERGRRDEEAEEETTQHPHNELEQAATPLPTTLILANTVNETTINEAIVTQKPDEAAGRS